MSPVSYEIIENIGIITIDNPPVNALSHAVRVGLVETVHQAQNDESDALLLICTGKTFIAGADISEFGKPPQEPFLPDVLNTLEQSDKLIVAALHGQALGGGFETALSCHYRCALASAKVGLPEVNLGLLPGAGGTQRTPRLAGVKVALDLILSGKPISASTALEDHLIDHVFAEGDLKTQALAYTKGLVAQKAPLRRASEQEIDQNSFDGAIFDQYRKTYAKKLRNQNSPQLIVDCVEAATKENFTDGMKIERDAFLQCRASDQSAGLRHIFFAERQAAKIKDLPRDTATRDIQSIAIIGAGLMGGGIAMNFANAGIPVKMLEINDDALNKGLANVAKIYRSMAAKNRISPKESEKRIALISGTTDYNDLQDVDLVIEAVFESIEVKKDVFTKLDQVCKDGAILATNTSYLDINEIAQFTKRPQDVIGLHFFSPAHIMKLLEIVRADETVDDVMASAMALARKIKKVPVQARVCYGFIGNRMLRQYQREVQMCLIEGASPEQIDKSMMDWGMAMGPLMVADLAGLDISYKARQALSDEQKGDPKSYRIPDVLFEMGRIGQKSGSGYYIYDPQTKARTADPSVNDIIEREAAAFGVTRKAMSDEEVLNRLSLALINEGFKILEEGIAQRASDIDVVYCFGYGFPKYRGGPMLFAQTRGLDKVYQDICAYRESHGDLYWTPSKLLQNLVETNTSLSDWEESTQ
ncbi:3-hydroxyacyl-CoA dehydrogenase [Terasakiella brassicae]|uniref:3-hydroxyacyl-CoA dehydrogenase n=1 Tax=Terasakiella brassicae TaxID=1634917 RepID=A0A917F9I3_9PROT|nr:3-hydroxyacyl-CoA dehydrogenase NAD-binding domain-containing protein [Terasakiella brassicae]GGF58386.1 3-hydroxyacyl-CoA dehydrogenase [Terasakiella brassicae]